jgi:hypothetical protein
MRRASICLAVLGLAALGVLPAAASAEITVEIAKFKAKAIPIPKPGGGNWPKTGNILGAGSAIEAEYEFKGEGYGPTASNPKGGIPPLAQVNFFLPAGVKLHPAGFPTCPEATLKNQGVAKKAGGEGCPPNTAAGPVGVVQGEVFFGADRVSETTTVQAVFGPNGAIQFYSEAPAPSEFCPGQPSCGPASFTLVSSGKYVHASAPYGEELETLVPPVLTIAEGSLASVKTIKIKAGAAIKKGKKVIYYGTLPKKCKGGLPVKTEVIFGGSNIFGNFGIPPITKTATFKAPCPKKH